MCQKYISVISDTNKLQLLRKMYFKASYINVLFFYHHPTCNFSNDKLIQLSLKTNKVFCSAKKKKMI